MTSSRIIGSLAVPTELRGCVVVDLTQHSMTRADNHAPPATDARSNFHPRNSIGCQDPVGAVSNSAPVTLSFNLRSYLAAEQRGIGVNSTPCTMADYQGICSARFTLRVQRRCLLFCCHRKSIWIWLIFNCYTWNSTQSLIVFKKNYGHSHTFYPDLSNVFYAHKLIKRRDTALLAQSYRLFLFCCQTV